MSASPWQPRRMRLALAGCGVAVAVVAGMGCRSSSTRPAPPIALEPAETPTPVPAPPLSPPTHHSIGVPDALSSEWREWELEKSQRLVDIARAWHQLETDDERAGDILVQRGMQSGELTLDYGDSTEFTPDRSGSTAILLQALSLDPSNLVARCLLAANQADSAYQGEGTWDEAEIGVLIDTLETIARQLSQDPPTVQEQLALSALVPHFYRKFGYPVEYWQPESIRKWWQANEHRLTRELGY